METVIRRNLKGADFADARKQARKAVEAEDGVAKLRALADGLMSPTMAAGFRLIADELELKQASDARIAKARAEVIHAIEHGCPTCGRPMRRNNSMAGWWQCSQLGAEGFRADPTKPSCSFQGFTE